jgi:hypothetical protein
MKAPSGRFHIVGLLARREKGVRRIEPVSFCAQREIGTEYSCVDIPPSFRHSE